jgi:hypothetical protein
MDHLTVLPKVKKIDYIGVVERFYFLPSQTSSHQPNSKKVKAIPNEGLTPIAWLVHIESR